MSPRTKGGRGLAGALGPAGRETGRRGPGARAAKAGCADFCFFFPGQWEKIPGTPLTPMKVEGRRRTVYSGASGKNAGLELQGYSYAKDFDAVVFLLFSIFFFLSPTLKLGPDLPGSMD